MYFVPKQGAEPTIDGLADAMIDFVARNWVSDLPRRWSKKAHEWILWGEDSPLLIRVDSTDKKGRTPIVFVFDLSAAWAADLASHWLRLVLADEREVELADLAHDFGFTVDRDEFPDREDKLVFFEWKQKQIGYVDAGGVMWELPDNTYVKDVEMTTDLRTMVMKLRRSKGCRCPYCEKLGLGAFAKPRRKRRR